MWKCIAALGFGIAAFTPVVAQQTTTFRSNVNMLAVDAMVVDRTGTPILGLLPDDFGVTVNNQPRRVVSATLVKYADSTAPSVSGSITPPMTLASMLTPGRVSDDGRVF